MIKKKCSMINSKPTNVVSCSFDGVEDVYKVIASSLYSTFWGLNSILTSSSGFESGFYPLYEAFYEGGGVSKLPRFTGSFLYDNYYEGIYFLGGGVNRLPKFNSGYFFYDDSYCLGIYSYGGFTKFSRSMSGCF